jgi:hypothetical protein
MLCLIACHEFLLVFLCLLCLCVTQSKRWRQRLSILDILLNSVVNRGYGAIAYRNLNKSLFFFCDTLFSTEYCEVPAIAVL